MQYEKLKLVFWDWSNTLVAKDVHSFLHKNNAINQELISKDIDYKNLTLEQFNDIKKIFNKYKTDKIPYTWVLVEKFFSLGVLQVIVSNGVLQNIKNFLKKDNYFDMILTSENFLPKPQIEMFEYAINKLKIDQKTSMIMIGDSVNDEIAAENFGIKFYKIEDYFFSSLKIMKDFELF